MGTTRDATAPQTTVGTFLARAGSLGGRPFLHYPENGGWGCLTWAEARERVLRVAAALVAEGVRPGDRVVGAAQLSGESSELVFITSDAQLLRFPASSVRPQGRAAGGMAGVRLSSGASVVWFGAVDAAAAAGVPVGPPGSYSPAVVVTVAGSAGALPGTAGRSVKVTPLHEFPGKGRATGGVRCHRFLKGEDVLVLAWAGAAPAVGATDSGSPVDLPDPVGKRDGSGVSLRRQLAVLGGSGRVP